MKKINCSFILVLLLGSCSDEQTKNPRLELRSRMDLLSLTGTAAASGSGNWGYTSPEGRNLALTGTSFGLSIVDVTNPASPSKLGFIAGPHSTWREVKTFGPYAYVTTEANHGLDIIDLSNPDAPRKVQTWRQTFTSAHTLWIDTQRQLLFANGARKADRSSAGMRILSLANPEQPVDLGAWHDLYVHDSYVRGNFLYAAAINRGFLAVVDISTPSNPKEVTRFRTGGAFTHNAWLSANGRYLYTTDEKPTYPVQVWDLENANSPKVAGSYLARPEALAHNVMVDGDRLLVAHYGDGVHLLDTTDPAHPKFMASYDTVPGDLCPTARATTSQVEKLCHDDCGLEASIFCGTWGAYIFPGSNLILASDLEAGLTVLEYMD